VSHEGTHGPLLPLTVRDCGCGCLALLDRHRRELDMMARAIRSLQRQVEEQPTPRVRRARREHDSLFERGLRRCWRCHEVKELPEFRRRAEGLGGYDWLCRCCDAARARRSRSAA
jgi:hypothetical protein